MGYKKYFACLASLWMLSLLIVSCQDSMEQGDVPNTSYQVDSIVMPEGLSGEVGAIDFLPDGRLVAAFRRGEVMIYNPEDDRWRNFAKGLHLPLGLLVEDSSEMLVMEYPELTRLVDTNGDGQADVYENVTDDFGVAGNYHEFAYGPIRDKQGNLYIALNSTSSGGVMMDEVRGQKKEIGFRESGMYSAVPYRGWVMKLTPDGTLHPYASGFRSPDGIGFDTEGRLLITDNQGDWVGTSPLYVVEEGQFYGHPAGLVWKRDWNRGKPTDLPLDTLKAMKENAAVLFPHNIMANSPTQPLAVMTDGKFGPFEGQILVGEMNQPRIVRVMLEEINGTMQGACIPFLDEQGLRKGNHRMAFAPDGSLWVGQNASGWGGSSGIQQIKFTGRMPVDVQSVHLTSDGFNMDFTASMDDSLMLDTANYKITSYYYDYHAKYGSDQFDKKSIQIQDVQVSEQGKQLHLTLEPLEKNRVYEFHLQNFKSIDGDTLANSLICYTLNELK